MVLNYCGVNGFHVSFYFVTAVIFCSVNRSATMLMWVWSPLFVGDIAGFNTLVFFFVMSMLILILKVWCEWRT